MASSASLFSFTVSTYRFLIAISAICSFCSGLSFPKFICSCACAARVAKQTARINNFFMCRLNLLWWGGEVVLVAQDRQVGQTDQVGHFLPMKPFSASLLQSPLSPLSIYLVLFFTFVLSNLFVLFRFLVLLSLWVD